MLRGVYSFEHFACLDIACSCTLAHQLARVYFRINLALNGATPPAPPPQNQELQAIKDVLAAQVRRERDEIIKEAKLKGASLSVTDDDVADSGDRRYESNLLKDAGNAAYAKANTMCVLVSLICLHYCPRLTARYHTLYPKP